MAQQATFQWWAAEKHRRELRGPVLCDTVYCLKPAAWVFVDTEAPWRTFGCEGCAPRMRLIYYVGVPWSTIEARRLGT